MGTVGVINGSGDVNEVSVTEARENGVATILTDYYAKVESAYALLMTGMEAVIESRRGVTDVATVSTADGVAIRRNIVMTVMVVYGDVRSERYAGYINIFD